MGCPKCKGFMVYTEVREGHRKEESWRCVNCGTYIVDKVPNLKCFVCGYVKCECKGKNWSKHVPKGKEN